MDEEQILKILEIVQQIAMIAVTVMGTWWAKTSEEKARLERIAKVAKGVGAATAAFAPLTDTDIDDKLAEMAKAVETELGRKMWRKEVATFKGVIAEMAVNNSKPNVARHGRATTALAKIALGVKDDG